MLKTQSKDIVVPLSLLKRSRIAVVRSEFNQLITQSLEDNCLRVLLQKGVERENIKIYRVPGALEIPITAQKIAKRKIADVIITLGAVIRGETYHFDLVANECTRGCMDVALKYNIPVIFEVLVAYNLKQAKERSANNDKNKGREAAITALKMVNIMSKIK